MYLEKNKLNLTVEELEAKLSPAELKERRETLKNWHLKDQVFVVNCSGIMSPLPKTQAEWDEARENGLFQVDGADRIFPKF